MQIDCLALGHFRQNFDCNRLIIPPPLASICKTMTPHILLSVRIFFVPVGQRGWSGGVMVLGKLPVPGRPTIWIPVGQGPTALAIGAGVFLFWTLLLSSILSLFFLSLSLGDGPI